MGGLGPGIGGAEYLIIAIVALLVVGPERLPAMLHTLGKWVAKARNMANEFRASFDEMARQSELDELRKEVEALRRDQMVPLGHQASSTFRDIEAELTKSPAAALPAATLPAPEVEPSGDPAPPKRQSVKPKPAKARSPRSAAAKTNGRKTVKPS